MTFYACFLPHGSKVHATTTPPEPSSLYDVRVPVSHMLRRGRASLCGEDCFAEGPIEWGKQLFVDFSESRCQVCQAILDSRTIVPGPRPTDTDV